MFEKNKKYRFLGECEQHYGGFLAGWLCTCDRPHTFDADGIGDEDITGLFE